MSKEKNTCPHFFTRFDPLIVEGTHNDEPSLTQQHFKDDCDINVIYKRFVKENGGIDPINDQIFNVDYDSPIFDNTSIHGLGDVFDVADYATNAFMNLSAEIREKFENDPAKMRSVVEKYYNQPEVLAKYGLIVSGQKGVPHAQTQDNQKSQQENVQKDGSTDSQEKRS